MTAALPSTAVAQRRGRLRGRDPILVVAVGVLVVIVLIALIGPFVSADPDAVDIRSANLGPGGGHLLGTDALGRDVLARALAGSRLSLLGPALVTIASVTIGTALAVIGTWRGGWFDRLLVRVLDVVFAFPALLFGVLAVAVLGTGLVAPVIALSVAYVPYVARLMRSVLLRQRHLAYVESCQLLGYSPWRTVTRHVLVNVRLYVIAQATLTFGYALIDLAAISFIGLGVQPPAAEWGLMVSNGAPGVLNGAPWEAVAGGVLIVVTVVTMNVLGERITAAAERAA
jgi:peptide/nickel transport system permease protein